jgi:hypothetical protein
LQNTGVLPNTDIIVRIVYEFDLHRDSRV